MKLTKDIIIGLSYGFIIFYGIIASIALLLYLIGLYDYIPLAIIIGGAIMVFAAIFKVRKEVSND